MKYTDDFHYKRKPSCATTKLTLFTVSKDEWDTKKDSIIHTVVCQKGTSQTETMSDSEKKSKPLP